MNQELLEDSIKYQTEKVKLETEKLKYQKEATHAKSLEFEAKSEKIKLVQINVQLTEKLTDLTYDKMFSMELHPSFRGLCIRSKAW